MKNNNKNIANQITKIFDDNELNDLNAFIKKRHCLNNCNLFLIYLFHLVQSSGILITTIASGYNIQYLIWVGIGFNVLASLINIYEKINNDMLKKLMIDIKKIKDGNYVDESAIIDIENNTNNNTNNNSTNNSTNNNSTNNNSTNNNNTNNNSTNNNSTNNSTNNNDETNNLV